MMLAVGWVYKVSMPSAAPISGMLCCAKESLGGTVTDLFMAMRRGVAFMLCSGVDGAVEAAIFALDLLPTLVCAYVDGSLGSMMGNSEHFYFYSSDLLLPDDHIGM